MTSIYIGKDDKGHLKIGMTTNHPREREKSAKFRIAYYAYTKDKYELNQSELLLAESVLRYRMNLFYRNVKTDWFIDNSRYNWKEIFTDAVKDINEKFAFHLFPCELRSDEDLERAIDLMDMTKYLEKWIKE